MAPPTHAKTKPSHTRANGSLGRAAFESALAGALKRDPIATLLFVDLDGLMDLNAAHGHDAGDRAIATVSAALATAAKRERWTHGRIGGDEFAILASGVALETAFLRADQIRRDTNAALAKALPPSQHCTVTI